MIAVFFIKQHGRILKTGMTEMPEQDKNAMAVNGVINEFSAGNTGRQRVVVFHRIATSDRIIDDMTNAAFFLYDAGSFPQAGSPPLPPVI